MIVSPINELSDAATKYCEDDILSDHGSFDSVNIHTKDEIENLSESIKKMEHDINNYVSNYLAANEELHTTKELAYKDALTGVRNKMSYDMMVEEITSKLASGDEKFGIAMIDLNYLKKINDTCGHERGDTAIIRLCDIICTVFKHSPVFRIGGDEFVVMLHGRDYDHVRSLVEQFKESIEENIASVDKPMWERVSAAIGYALYDNSKDKSVEDVFKRADKEMYDHKSSMKAGRE